MSTEQHKPLWSERHISSINLRLLLALGTVLVALLLQAWELLFIGVGFAAYAWLSTPDQYVIYSDRLIIFYGRPRTRHVFFEAIEWVDSLPIAFGSRLRLRLNTRGRLMIQPRNLEEFKGKLQAAIQEYQGSRDGGQSDPGS